MHGKWFRGEEEREEEGKREGKQESLWQNS